MKQTESNRIGSNSGDQSDEINVSAIKYINIQKLIASDNMISGSVKSKDV